MFVYEISEETQLFTKYMLVPVEDCGCSFIDDDEMKELCNSLPYYMKLNVNFNYETRRSDYIVILKSEGFDNAVNDVISAFKELPPNRKTIASPLDLSVYKDEQIHSNLSAIYVNKLNDVGFTKVGNRIQRYTPPHKKPKNLLSSARNIFTRKIISYLNKKYGFEMEIKYSNRLKVQLQTFQLASDLNIQREEIYAHDTYEMSTEEKELLETWFENEMETEMLKMVEAEEKK